MGYVFHVNVRGALFLLWFMLIAPAFAGSIEPVRAALTSADNEITLAAEFTVALGPRLEEVISRSVPLHFKLEFTLSQPRWYWTDEHLVHHITLYRLTYNPLMRQYRLSKESGLHQNFTALSDALRTLSRVGALLVASSSSLKLGGTYACAVRLSLDRSLLPKPLQIDALTDRDWQVNTQILRWPCTIESVKDE